MKSASPASLRPRVCVQQSLTPGTINLVVTLHRLVQTVMGRCRCVATRRGRASR